MRRVCFVVCLLLCFICFAKADEKPLDWGPLYYEFIVGEQYPLGDESYYTGSQGFGVFSTPRFALHDMDGDGVPELIADNDCPYTADHRSHIYTVVSGRMHYAGSIGEPPLYYFPDAVYPGLFYYGGRMGDYLEVYYTLENAERSMVWVYHEYTERTGGMAPGIYKAEENNPVVDELYDLILYGSGKTELQFFTADKVRQMGLNSFMHLVTDADLSGISEKSPGQSGRQSGDDSIDSRFGSDKAACAFIDAHPFSAAEITLREGQIFRFGDENNYKNPEKNTMEWVVLTVNEYGALLLSRYVIDCVPYQEARESVTWEKSFLRHWMNSKFLNWYFSDEQRDAVLTVRLQNPDNPVYRTRGGANTTDKVFALSYAEGERYLTKEIINTTATSLAIRNGAKLRKENKKKTVYWWLRTPGNVQARAMITSLKNDTLDYEGNGVGRYFDDGRPNNTGVRPALWLSWAYINSH